jgi:hypothetical protein
LYFTKSIVEAGARDPAEVGGDAGPRQGHPGPAPHPMTYPHPPSALGEARAPVSPSPCYECSLVLRLERSEAPNRFGRCRSIARGRKLRIEAPEYFVALGSLGAQGQIAVKSVQELWILASHVGDDLVAVRRHQARGMDQDTVPMPGSVFSGA